MKAALVCILLALVEHTFALSVCQQEVPDNANLIVSCADDKAIKYPNYNDMTTFYKCFGGQPQLQNCPAGQYFCYYQQNCAGCSNFIPPPPCDFFQRKTSSKCNSKASTTPKPTKTTAPKVPTPTADPDSTSATRPTKATRPPVPTPPSVKTTTSNIPEAPMIVTPVPGIPTPPSEEITPPSIPAGPPFITSIPTI